MNGEIVYLLLSNEGPSKTLAVINTLNSEVQFFPFSINLGKIDQFKVRIISKEPFPAAIDYLATTLAIHPAKYYKEVGPAGMNAKPVGSGPYKIIEYIPGKSVNSK